MQNVMVAVTKTVNCICFKGLRRRQLQELLRGKNVDFEDIPCYTEVQWLNRGKTLKRLFELMDKLKVCV